MNIKNTSTDINNGGDYMTNVKFVTIKELANRICEANFNRQIGFTFDSKEDIDNGTEPTGWYGIMMSNLFDGESCIIGYYGDGIIMAKQTWGQEDEVINFIITFFESEGVINILDDDTLVCVDANEFDNALV